MNFRPLVDSLADAEAAEDSAEQIVGVNGPDHRAEFIDRQACLEGQQLGLVFVDCHRMGMLKMLNALIHVMGATAQTRCQGGVACAAYFIGQPLAQFS